MRIIIKETEYEYESDYPSGWLSSSVDSFKFPVNIGHHSCFIKRLEKKSPDSISGWDLLVKLENKNEPNLAKIYDIKSVEEKGKRVYYVFYECIVGKTLDVLISDEAQMDLPKLTKEMFQAITALQKYGFWFADFFEKNIFLEDSGRFVLVDLDSAQPVSKLPEDSMWGSKAYWGCVFDFYSKILKYNDLKVSDLSGPSLNHLQIIFLILRIKISSDEGLPAKLDKIDPGFREVFSKLYKERKNPQHADHASEIEKLIIQKIINYKFSKHSGEGPVIKSFVSDTYMVGKGESFELSWDVAGAGYTELYRNGSFDKRFSAGETSIIKKTFYDGGAKTNYYKLIAYYNDHQVESDPIAIEFGQKSTPLPTDVSIEAFVANPDTITNGESFELSWKVSNASYVELYKNGAFDNKYDANESGVTKTAYYDGGVKAISYKLIAYSDDQKAESKTIAVRYKEDGSAPVGPKIEKFVVHPDTINSGEGFELSWKVNNADYIELYKNNALDTKIGAGQTSIKKIALYDGEEAVCYKLLAYKEDIETESDQVCIKIKKPVEALKVSIAAFYADPDAVRNGDIYKLNWEVTDAAYIELFINGSVNTRFTNGETSVSKTASFNAGAGTISCKIVAYNDGQKVESKLIYVKQKTTTPVSYYLTRIGIPLLALLIIGLVIKLWPHPKPQKTFISDVNPKRIFGQKTIYIYGKNFPANPSEVQVLLNNVPADITSSSGDRLVVNFPDAADHSLWKDSVKVSMIVNKDTLVAPMMVYVDSQKKQADIGDIDPEEARKNDSLAKKRKKDSMERVVIQMLKHTRDSIKAASAIKKQNDDIAGLREAQVADSIKRVNDKKTEETGRKKAEALVTVTVEFNKKTGLFSSKRVKDVRIIITNGSDYTLESAAVVVSYKSGNNENAKQTVNFSNVAAHTTASSGAPDGAGDNVVTSFESKKLK